MSAGSFLEGLSAGWQKQAQQSFENNLQTQKLQLAQQQEQNQGQYLAALSKAATMRAQNAGDKTFKYLSALGAIETRLGKLKSDLATQQKGVADQQDPAKIQALQQEINQWDGMSSLLFRKSMTGGLWDEGGGGEQGNPGGDEKP